MRVLLAAVLMLAGLGVVAHVQFGSLSVAQAYLRGDRLIVLPSEMSFGEGHVGSEKQVTFTVVNLTGKDVQLLGNKTGCSCVATDDFPVHIASGDRRDVIVKLRIVGNESQFDQESFFFTDFPGRRIFKVRIRGSILKDPDGGT